MSDDPTFTSHSALIGIETRGVKNWSLMKDAISIISKLGTIEKIAAVYSVNTQESPSFPLPLGRAAKSGTPGNSIERSEYGRKLSTVLVLNSEHSPKHLAFFLLSAEPVGRPSDREMVILAYGDKFQMIPQLTLPHPDLHSSPSWLVPASEIIGSWVHPVIQKSLSEIARPVQFHGAMEFFAQGKSLLDFSAP